MSESTFNILKFILLVLVSIVVFSKKTYLRWNALPEKTRWILSVLFLVIGSFIIMIFVAMAAEVIQFLFFKNINVQPDSVFYEIRYLVMTLAETTLFAYFLYKLVPRKQDVAIAIPMLLSGIALVLILLVMAFAYFFKQHLGLKEVYNEISHSLFIFICTSLNFIFYRKKIKSLKCSIQEIKT